MSKQNEITINVYNPKPKRRKKKRVEQPESEPDYPPPGNPPWNYQDRPDVPHSSQCKAAIWLYDWLEYYLQGMTQMTGIQLFALNQAIKSLVGGGVRALVTQAILATIVALTGTPGPTPDDFLTWTVAFIIARTLTNKLADLGIVPEYTIADFQDALTKVQSVKDDIICDLSQAQDDLLLVSVFEQSLEPVGLSLEQGVIVTAILNEPMLRLLFYTRWFFTSFNDEYLSTVAGDCC